jgi:hypothetical protein
MGKKLLGKPLGEILAIHLAMIIPGASLGLKHQLRTANPPQGGDGVNDDQPRAFARRLVHPRAIGFKIPRVVVGMVDVEIRFIQIDLGSVSTPSDSARW